MSLDTVTLELNAALVARLYNEKGGHYRLIRIVDGKYRRVRELDRAEALTYRCARDEVLRHVYPTQRKHTRTAREVARARRGRHRPRAGDGRRN